MMFPVVPACIPKNREDVLSFLNTVSFAHEVQIDVVDGKFVENSSWPYSPAGNPKTIKHVLDRYTLEVDLMVEEPVTAAHLWIEAGADMLVFHIETLPLEVFKNFSENCAVTVGVASHGDLSTKTLLEYAEYADYVQLMGIKEIGKQGEPFNKDVLHTIREIKNTLPEIMVSIDGSVNMETITSLKDAGADRFVAGSAVLKTSKPEKAYEALCALVN